ncbi:MAG: hypothetical protein SGI92_30585 [Bryobacteraceae bacterium]|nr:hypothetical protein [Bryobacteraceae bacterium]
MPSTDTPSACFVCGFTIDDDPGTVLCNECCGDHVAVFVQQPRSAPKVTRLGVIRNGLGTTDSRWNRMGDSEVEHAFVLTASQFEAWEMAHSRDPFARFDRRAS